MTFRTCHLEIPWAGIIGMRHKIVHDYFGIDLDVVWATAQEDLPPLREQISALLAGH